MQHRRLCDVAESRWTPGGREDRRSYFKMVECHWYSAKRQQVPPYNIILDRIEESSARQVATLSKSDMVMYFVAPRYSAHRTSML